VHADAVTRRAARNALTPSVHLLGRAWLPGGPERAGELERAST
jgi:hypothetical protein